MRILLLGAALAASSAASAQDVSPQVMAVHERALTLDTHLDTPASLAIAGWRIGDRHDHAKDMTQVDVPRMKAGGLDGGFWAIYTPQGPLDLAGYAKARNFALLRGVAIREMVAADPANFALAAVPADAARIAAQGKRIVYMSIENAYPLGDDISLIDTFYDLGVRVSGFAHFLNNQVADSSTDPAGKHWGGLSPAGIALLARMNALGIVADASHSSDGVLDDLLRLSTAPILLTHSGCKAVYDHPRNIDDAHLRALAAKGGVIQINSYGAYLRAHAPNPARAAAMKALYGTAGEGGMTLAAREKLAAQRAQVDKDYPETDRATFADFFAHLEHALKVAGVDHVGIGMDWDGGGGAAGIEDVTALPKITAALLKAGYTEADIDKIWSGNVLRVLAAAQAKATVKAD